MLKDKLANVEISLTDQDEEEKEIGDETDVLKVSKIADEGKDKINVVFSYSYDVGEEQFTDNVEVEIQMGLTAKKELLLSFNRVDGNLLYYKKALSQLRQTCLA